LELPLLLQSDGFFAPGAKPIAYDFKPESTRSQYQQGGKGRFSNLNPCRNWLQSLSTQL
jgi:hypothetical protein